MARGTRTRGASRRREGLEACMGIVPIVYRFLLVQLPPEERFPSGSLSRFVRRGRGGWHLDGRRWGDAGRSMSVIRWGKSVEVADSRRRL